MRVIQIRNVPDDVHRELRMRAAAAGVSLSDFALGELAAAIQRAPISEVVREADSREQRADTTAIVAVVRATREGA